LERRSGLSTAETGRPITSNTLSFNKKNSNGDFETVANAVRLF
jgi:hypothetical protein